MDTTTFPTIDQFTAARQGENPLDTIRQYRNEVKLHLLKNGEFDDEADAQVDQQLFQYAAQNGIVDTKDEATARRQFFSPPQNTDAVDADIVHRQSLDDGDTAAGEAATRYRALLSDHVRSSYDDPVEYQKAVEEAKMQFTSVVPPEKLMAARRAAVERGDTPFAVISDGKNTRLDISPEMLKFAGNDAALAAHFEANPELDRSLMPEVRRKLATPEGFTAPLAAIERQQDFLQAIDKLSQKDTGIAGKFATLKNAVDDGAEDNLDPLLDQIDTDLGQYGLHGGYTLEERKAFLKDALQFSAAPAVNEQDVDANVRKTSTGQAVLPMGVMLNKPLFDRTMAESKAIPEAQKQALKETRDAQISAYAPEAFKVIAENRSEFPRFLQERRDQGKSNAAILDEWMANPDNYSTFRSWATGTGESVLEAAGALIAYPMAMAGNETARWSMEQLQKSDAERRQYAQLFGKNLSAGYDIARLVAPVAADVSVSLLTAGAAAPLVTAKSSLRSAVKATLGNALRAETKGALASFARGAAESALERGLAQGAEKVSMKGVASVLPVDDVLTLAGSDIAHKFTQSAVTASYLGTAFNRSAGSTYVQLSSTLAEQKNPDGTPKYSPSEVRQISLNHGLLAGLSTAVVTGAFSFLGRAGMESIYGGMSKRQLDGVFRRLKTDFSKLSPAVTEGLDMSSAAGMLTSAIQKNAKSLWRELGKDATDEGLEEFTDQIAQGINQAYAEDKKIDVTSIAKEALYAGMLGGVMGGGVVGIREGFSSGKVSAVDETSARRSLLLETARNLRNANATRTAEAIERFAIEGLPKAASEGSVPAGETPAGDVPAPSDAGVAPVAGSPETAGTAPLTSPVTSETEGNAVPESAGTATPSSGVQISNIDALVSQGGGTVQVSVGGRSVNYKQFGIVIDGNTAEVAFVELDPSERGKSVGLEAYKTLGKELAARGITLQSSKAQYGAGRGVWAKLAQKGLARKGAQGVYYFNANPETETQSRDSEVFPDETTFAGKLKSPATLKTYENREGYGIAEYANKESGDTDVYMAAFGDNDYIAYIRVYENGVPTNRFTSKLERRTESKGVTRRMVEDLQKRLPKGHEYAEDVSVSTDGLKFIASQITHGYEVLRDGSGKPVTTRVGLSGESNVNDLPIAVDPNGAFDNIAVRSSKDFNKVRAYLAEKLKSFDPSLGANNVHWTDGEVFIDLPVLKKSADTVAPDATVPQDSTIPQDEADAINARHEQRKALIEKHMSRVPGVAANPSAPVEVRDELTNENTNENTKTSPQGGSRENTSRFGQPEIGERDIVVDFVETSQSDRSGVPTVTTEDARVGTPDSMGAAEDSAAEKPVIRQTTIGGQPRWELQSEENRQRVARGERELGGNLLFGTREEAIAYADSEKKLAEKNKEFLAKQEARAAEEARVQAEKDAPLKSYLDAKGTTPLAKGNLKKALEQGAARRDSTRNKTYQGPRHKVVRDMVADGYRATTAEVEAIKDPKRNLMDNREQAAFDKRKAAAGMKTEYRLQDPDDTFYVVTKAEHDYAQWLTEEGSGSASTSGKPAIPQEGQAAAPSGSDESGSGSERTGSSGPGGQPAAQTRNAPSVTLSLRAITARIEDGDSITASQVAPENVATVEAAGYVLKAGVYVSSSPIGQTVTFTTNVPGAPTTGVVESVNPKTGKALVVAGGKRYPNSTITSTPTTESASTELDITATLAAAELDPTPEQQTAAHAIAEGPRAEAAVMDDDGGAALRAVAKARFPQVDVDRMSVGDILALGLAEDEVVGTLVAAENPTPEAPASKVNPITGIEILPPERAAEADIQLGISQGANYFTLWFKKPLKYDEKTKRSTGGFYNYLTILSKDIDEARAKAQLYAEQIASGEKLPVAFAGRGLQGAGNAKSVAVTEGMLDRDAIEAIEKTPIGEQTVGVGQGESRNILVKDLLSKDPGLANWIINKAYSGRLLDIANYLKQQPAYLEAQDERELESERIKAYEERRAARSIGKQVSVTTLVRKEGEIVEVDESEPEAPKKEKLAERKAKDQIANIIEAKSDDALVPQELAVNMFPMQVSGANSTLASMRDNGVALNGDGAGVGKTRQIIAVASHYAKQGKRVFIITENAAIGKPWEKKSAPKLGGSMSKDSEAMGVSLELLGEVPQKDGGIYVTTYNRVKSADIPDGAILIFDESQNLANTFGATPGEKEGSELRQWEDKFRNMLPRAEAVAYYSATPADKPHQLAYLHKVLGYTTPEDYLSAAVDNGVVIKTRKFGRTEKKYYDVPSAGKRPALYKWVNGLMMQAGEQGRFIKREISYEGTDVQFQDVTGTDEAKNPWAEEFNKVLEGMANIQAAGMRLLAPDSYVLYAAELTKIGTAVEMAKKEMTAGRKVVLYFSRIKEMEIRARTVSRGFDGEIQYGEPEVVGTIPSPVALLKGELDKLGIRYAELHGQSGTTSQKAQKAFETDTDVLLASVESGGTGINLDDTTGKQPRTEIFMFAPYRGISTVQAMGRIWRASTIQNDNNPNRYVMVVASDIKPDAFRSAVLAKKLQLMGAAMGGTAVARMPMSKTSYRPEQLAGLEMPEDGSENAFEKPRTGKLKPVKIDWKQAKSGNWWSPATADVLEWEERGGPERTGLEVRVFKGDSGWVVVASEPYTAQQFAPDSAQVEEAEPPVAPPDVAVPDVAQQPATVAPKEETPVMLELAAHGDPTTDLPAFLASVAAKGKPEHRALARLLSLFPAPTVVTVNVPGGKFAGAFVPATGQVLINTARRGPRGAVDTVLHELIHAATEYSILNPNAKQAVILKRIDGIRRNILKRAEVAGMTHLRYGLGSNSEFFTHFLTSPQFQRDVAALTPKKEKSFIEVIIEAIKDLLNGRAVKKADEIGLEIVRDMVEFMQSADATEDTSRMGQLLLQPADVRDISRFYELTEGVTPENVEAWRRENEGAYAELKEMRERVLREMGWDVGPVYRFDDESQPTVFDSEEGGAIYTSVVPQSFFNKGMPVREFLLKTETVATPSDVESLGLDEHRKGDVSFLSDKEVSALKAKGFGAAAGPLGIKNRVDEYAVFDPNQIKSTEPLNFQNGRLIPPQEWGDSQSPDIRFQLAEEPGAISMVNRELSHAAGLRALTTATDNETTYYDGQGTNEGQGGDSQYVTEGLQVGREFRVEKPDQITEKTVDFSVSSSEAERLKSFHDYAVTGNVPAHEVAYYRTNPSAMARLTEYLKAAVREMWTRVRESFDPRSAVYLDRLTRELDKARNGYRVVSNSVDMVGVRMQPSVTSELDTYYMDSVESDDMETAQRLVHQASFYAMGDPIGVLREPNGDRMKMYHGSGHSDHTVFSLEGTPHGGKIRPERVGRGIDKLGFWFTSSKSQGEAFSFVPGKGNGKTYSVYLDIRNPLILRSIEEWNDWVERYAAFHGNDADMEIALEKGGRSPAGWFNAEMVRERLRLGGKDGIVVIDSNLDGRFGLEENEGFPTWAIALDSSQVKSADPVTYEEQEITNPDGTVSVRKTVIPLSQRFNTASPDIRFQLTDDASPVDRPNMAGFFTVRDGDSIMSFRKGERNPAKDKGGIKNWLKNLFTTGSDLTASMEGVRKAGKDIQRSADFILTGFENHHNKLTETTKPEDIDRVNDLLGMALGDTSPELTPEAEQKLNDEVDSRLAVAAEIGKPEIAAARKERDRILGRKSSTADEKKAAKKAFAIAEAMELDRRNKAYEQVMDWQREEKIRLEVAEIQERRRVRDLAQKELDNNFPEWGELSYKMRQAMTDIQSLLMDKYGKGHRLYAKIDRTRGVYLVRAYQIHKDPNYAQKMLSDPDWEDRRNAAIRYFEEVLTERTVEKLRGKVPGWDTMSEEEIRKVVEAQRVSDAAKRLKATGEYANVDDAALETAARNSVAEQARLMFEDLILGHGISSRSGLSGNEIRTNVSRFLQKKNIPEEIREALGEIKDPFYNAMNTYRELAGLAHSHFMLENLTKAGIASGLFVSKAQVEADPARYHGWKPVVSSDVKSIAYAPLAGQYAEPDIVEAFKAAFGTGGHDSHNTAQKAATKAGRFLMGAAGLSLGVTTLGSISYYLRNPIGNYVALLAQGHVGFDKESGRSWAKTKDVAFNSGKLSPEREAEIAEEIALGVLNNGSNIGYIREMWDKAGGDPDAAVEWLEEKLGDTMADLVVAAGKGLGEGKELLANLAQLSEEAPLNIEYKKNVKLLERAKWGTPAQIKQEAARRAKMVVFTRTEVPQGIQAFTGTSVATLVAPYIRFKSEVARTFFNTYKLAHQDIKSGNPVLRAEGFKRMASAVAVHGAVTIALPLILQQIAGIGDDEDKALRAAMPGYDKNTSFYFFRTASGLKSVNLTYLNPYSLTLDPLTSTLRSAMYNRWDDIPDVWTRVFTDEVFGENIVAGKVIDVKRNIDEATGLPIYLPTDDMSLRFLKSAMHVADAYKPKVLDNAVKAYQSAQRNSTQEQPWFYSPSGILLGQLLPTKVRDHDLEDMSYRAFRELQDANRQMWTITSKMKSPQGFPVDDVEKTYERLRDANTKVQRDAYDVAMGYKKLLISLGMNPAKANNTVYQSMLRADFSREKVAGIMRGWGVKRNLTPETIQKVNAIDPNVMRKWNEIDRKYADDFKLGD